jgi:hypothetical protein
MGCFCKQAVDEMLRKQRARPKPADAQERPEPTPAEELVAAASQWLSNRWLPEVPWEPDPEWMDDELPPPPLPPESLGVLTALIQAGQACTEVMEVDPAEPQQLRRLARVIGTLNRRSAALAELVEDDEVWGRLAAQNSQADAVLATLPEVFDPEQPDSSPPLGPWRQLISQVKAIAPWVAVGQMLDLDLADPEAVSEIAEQVRKLRAVTLPPLEQPLVVHRMIARASSQDRLRRSLGIDPDDQPVEEVEALVRDKVDRAAESLPPALRAGPEGLEGAPVRGPNPSQLVNPAVMEAARKIQPQTLPWKVPTYDQLPLLGSGAPVLSLVRLLGPRIIRASPCAGTCDAAAALADVESRRS